MSDDRLPTALWVDAHLRQLEAQAIPYYIVNQGNHASGTVMLKLFAPGYGCKLLQQQRDLDGNMAWMNMFKEDITDEKRVDDFIRRTVSRDPDIWIIEIEDKNYVNPFEGIII
jgi:hypothetical protein